MEQPLLDKLTFNDEDFDILGFHDNYIIAMMTASEGKTHLKLLIDYIVSWALPPGSEVYTYWKSPAVLIFNYPLGLKFNIELQEQHWFQWDILDISRTDRELTFTEKDMIKRGLEVHKSYDYVIETGVGNIDVIGATLELHLLSQPIYTGGKSNLELEAFRNKIFQEKYDEISRL